MFGRFNVPPTDPMTHRDPILPLIVSAVVALALHAALVPGIASYGWGGGELRPLARLDPPAPQEDKPKPDEPTLGRDDAKAASVAWIAYDDFRTLLARQARTHQPAVQQQVDPVANAPAELDPTPPAPTAPRTPPPAPAAPSLPRAAALTPPTPASVPFTLDDVGDVHVPFAPTALLTDASALPTPPSLAAPTAASVEPAPARPTQSPRADRESPPTTVKLDHAEIRPGQVLTGEGIEIRTAFPRPSVASLTTALGTAIDPQAVVRFGHTGQVIDVKLVRSTGFEGLDGAVIASFYKWTARGRRIDALREQDAIALEFTFIFGRR